VRLRILNRVASLEFTMIFAGAVPAFHPLGAGAAGLGGFTSPPRAIAFWSAILRA